MTGKKSELGPTGANVNTAVRRLRKKRNLGYAELSRRLADLGREIPPLALRRIEAGNRRVDADDLVCLALALQVSPVTLLMPGMPRADDPAAMVEITAGRPKVSAALLWLWLTADLHGAAPTGLLPTEFASNAQPVWQHAHWSDYMEDVSHGDD